MTQAAPEDLSRRAWPHGQDVGYALSQTGM